MKIHKEVMKAAVLYKKEVIKIEDLPIPGFREDEVLVKIKAAGICGSDLAYYYGKSPIGTKNGKGPIILGHELSGVIEDVGELPKRLKLFKRGDRVLINPIQNCNLCEDCLDGNINTCRESVMIGINKNGGFAEYCVSKYASVYKLPENIPFSIGALIEPIACAINGLDELSVKINQFIVIVGDGPISILLTNLLKKAGAGKILVIGKHDFKLNIAKEFGADHIINIMNKNSIYYEKEILEKIKILNYGKYADSTVIASGSNEALDIAINTIGNKGKLVVFGLYNEKCFLKIPLLRFLTMNQQIRSSWCAPYSWPKAIKYASENERNLKKLLTHTYELEEIVKAIEDLSVYSDNQIKVQIIF